MKTFSIQDFRIDCFRDLGFDGFTDYLTDELDLFAFLLPKQIYENEKETCQYLMDYIQAGIEREHWHCTPKIIERGEYTCNWYGSRFTTIILGPHILIHITPEEPLYPLKTLKKPILSNSWSIVSVDYNKMKPKGCLIHYYTTQYEAAFPEDYETTYNKMKSDIRALLSTA